jgi:hypothetical protein
MLRLLILGILIVVSCVIIIKMNTNKKPVLLQSDIKPIAIVKLKDTIYHCQSIARTKCGYTIDCGKTSIHCISNITVEYLR